MNIQENLLTLKRIARKNGFMSKAEHVHLRDINIALRTYFMEHGTEEDVSLYKRYVSLALNPPSLFKTDEDKLEKYYQEMLKIERHLLRKQVISA